MLDHILPGLRRFTRPLRSRNAGKRSHVFGAGPSTIKISVPKATPKAMDAMMMSERQRVSARSP